MWQLAVETHQQEELLDITSQVSQLVEPSAEGALLIYVPHTTAGVLINEHADPDVARDVLTTLDHIVPESLPYRHIEGNSPAHVKAVLAGASQLVPIREGRLQLGTWQGIFFAEFDGPRRRSVLISHLGPGQ